MSNESIKVEIHSLFIEIEKEVKHMVDASPNLDMATKAIMEYLSSIITAKSKGYIFSLYSVLSKEALKDPVLSPIENANKFYELDLRKKIYDAYQFDVINLNLYKNGIDFKEINAAFSSAASAAGTASIGGLLMAALSGTVDIPLALIIAGALLAGIGGGVAGYRKASILNKSRFRASVQQFLGELEKEMIRWVDMLTDCFNQEVETLKKSL